MKKLETKKSKILTIIQNELKDNIKEYLIISLIFIIGIVIGIIFINNASEEQKNIIQEHITSFCQNISSEDYKINFTLLLRNSIINNIILAVALWFIGSTIIGIPIVFLIIGIKGFSFGYTIASIMITYTTFKAILFTLFSLFLQNIIFIPAILAIAVSGIKVYKSITKDRRRENIKIEILRHTISSFFLALFLIISSFVETYLSGNLITMSIKLFA